MTRVAEFMAELQKRGRPKCAQWHRIDLHNHTPASFDYRYAGGDVVELLAQQILRNDLSVTMFTDHERLPDQSLVDTIVKKTRRTVLRGVELNVFVEAFDKDEGKVSNNLFYHLLVGFDPDGKRSPDYWLEEIYRRCGDTERDTNMRRIRGITSTPRQIAEVLEEANAIIIPAHMHTTRDISKTRSVDDIYVDPTFLKYAREAFTALEVVYPKTANFFDGRHQETGLLHKGCIRSSDSHEPSSLGWRYSYAQMETPTYEELKAALELPFRLSIQPPSEPDSYIIGMQISGEFFPDLWLCFSPHCNMLIAVKGSGKTSVLECLRFALGAEVPKSRAEGVTRHLAAILGPAGTVRVLVKRLDGAQVLVERSIANPAFMLSFEDDRQERLNSADGLLFPTQILGWHEIEQAATDVNVRRVYMDTGAGRTQIKTLEEDAAAIASRIRDRHTYTSQRYIAYRDLQRQVTRLYELRRGLQELTDASLIHLRDQYQRATEQREAYSRIIEQLERAQDPAVVTVMQLVPSHEVIPAGPSPLEEIIEDTRHILKQTSSTLALHAQDIRIQLVRVRDVLLNEQGKMDTKYQQFLQKYSESLNSLTPEQRRLLESHREVLEQTKALASLEGELAGVKQEVLGLLQELTTLCDRLAQRLDERTKIRREAVDRLNAILANYGVRLTILPQQISGDFNDLSDRYAGGARTLKEIRSKLPDRLAHLCLRNAYGGIYSSLDVEYGPLLFESAELSYLLSTYENDDLRIELKVGKAGQEFSPIDQLSAGQRCTAIFPMLLRLDQGPLIVDQPEDNLDNRHIANSIAPALMDDKRRRQMMFTSHNANLVVLSDAESIIMFESDGATGRIEQQGFFSTRQSPIGKHVIDVLDGGEAALRQRALKYGLSRSTA